MSQFEDKCSLIYLTNIFIMRNASTNFIEHVRTFCLTKGKSLVVKCKINFHTKILIRGTLDCTNRNIENVKNLSIKNTFQFQKPF